MCKEKSIISIICVYNNQNQFESQLKASLESQDVDYELIDIDNTNNKFYLAL